MIQLRRWCCLTPIITGGQLSYNFLLSRTKKINYSIIFPWCGWHGHTERGVVKLLNSGNGEDSLSAAAVAMFTLETVETAAVKRRRLNTAPQSHHIFTWQWGCYRRMIRSPSLSAEWISLVGRWGVHIMSLFCFSFSLRSYFSICFVYLLIFFTHRAFSFPSPLIPSPSAHFSLHFVTLIILSLCHLFPASHSQPRQLFRLGRPSISPAVFQQRDDPP